MAHAPAPPPQPGPVTGAASTRARLILATERLLVAAGPFLGVLAVGLALALFDLLPRLPLVGHLAVLVGWLTALGWAGWHGYHTMRWPSLAEAHRRIERHSGLKHRPHTTVADVPADTASPIAAALWARHQAAARAALTGAQVGPFDAQLARRDPHALRAAVAMVLLIAVVAAGDRAGERIVAALVPVITRPPTVAPVVDAWIDPPSYTGQAPLQLRSIASSDAIPTAPIPVPDGSRLVLRVSHLDRTPTLTLDASALPLEPAGERSWRVEQDLGSAGHLQLETAQGILLDQTIVLIPDHAPVIDFTKPPTATERRALRVDVTAADDYGLSDIWLELSLPGAEQAPNILPIPLASGAPTAITEVAHFDLTPHPWAGLTVQGRLIAIDNAGNHGFSQAIAISIPERVFIHPVARAIIEQRKRLVQGGADAAEPVADALTEIAQWPQTFGGDTGVFLALRTATARLMLSPHHQGRRDSVVDLLWSTALHLEMGDLPLAKMNLRQAQEELARALADPDTTDAEIERLMEQLRQAMNEFLAALVEQAQQRPDGPMAPIDPSQVLESTSLREMLDRIQVLAQTGSRDAAQQLLSQLNQMMEQLQAGRMRGDNAAQREAFDIMNELGALTEQQQQLLNETMRRAQEGAQSGQPQPGNGDPAGQQEALRDALGELMQRLGELMGDIPGPLGDAELDMRDATGALGEGDQQGAAQAQSSALEQLRSGLRSLSDQMMQAGQQPGGPGQGNGQMLPGDQQGQAGQQGPRRDPLGRDRADGQSLADGTVDIPTESEIQRARDVLRELRRRSGETDRAPAELDYLERLLRRF